MPEGPEVEGARCLLERNCRGKRITKAVAADDTTVIEGCTPKELEATLVGRTITGLHRKGKYLWWSLDGGAPCVLFHFGMTGGMVVEGIGAAHYKSVKADDSGAWPPRFTKLHIELADGTHVAFTDSRRFARIKLQADPTVEEPVSKLGFDVYTGLPPVDQFAAALRKRKNAKLKAVLLDQSFSAGIGNWVADEVLYQSRLHPEEAVSSLADDHISALHGAIRDVVQFACGVEADDAQFPRTWIFHYRWTGKKASSVDGQKIEFVTAGGRTSAYVPALQKLVGNGGGRKPKAAAAKPTKKSANKAADSEGGDDVSTSSGSDNDAAGVTVKLPRAKAAAAPRKRGAKAAAAALEEGAAAPQQLASRKGNAKAAKPTATHEAAAGAAAASDSAAAGAAASDEAALGATGPKPSRAAGRGKAAAKSQAQSLHAHDGQEKTAAGAANKARSRKRGAAAAAMPATDSCAVGEPGVAVKAIVKRARKSS